MLFLRNETKIIKNNYECFKNISKGVIHQFLAISIDEK